MTVSLAHWRRCPLHVARALVVAKVHCSWRVAYALRYCFLHWAKPCECSPCPRGLVSDLRRHLTGLTLVRSIASPVQGGGARTRDPLR
ncbi:uncharacterized protein LAESUDRAFT_304024 [Laetiporus sulphureus 93-53]|uniref:Uncharacterized protein n=1 Tax=Laetiporus sulphureus 93-53 TaxID=1314785 RepID=A0A165D862_9APHY|nr:uncharacterized protein LAESUDRAFT_304024 [Laetiporus sulphureus 93-53]KZT04304.1 hypothetical protein LAESUDRAFT_304024 [Laetiporus sulphureus 93-53]